MQSYTRLLIVFLVVVLVLSLHMLWQLLNERNDSSDSKCELYLHTSTMEGTGKGVFAGRDFNIHHMFRPTPVLYMAVEHIFTTQLFDYVYDDDDGFCTFNFGIANMCNSHRLRESVHLIRNVSDDDKVDLRVAAHDQHDTSDFETLVPIKTGSEMFVNYGGSWFRDRNIDETLKLPTKEVTLSELQSSGAQCLSHLYVEESEMPMAGKGVYSKVSYDEGDTVYISPVLVLPKQQLRMHEDSDVLLNYCISEEGSDAALLPIGLTGMLNHGGTHSNVRMEWFTGEGDENRLNLPLSELEDLPFAPLDIRYVATRPIAQGEELLLDYGTAWSQQWLQHLDRLIEWNENFSDRPLKALKPQFREPIGAPEGFFPAHFKSECIGKASCNESPSIKRRKAFTAMHRKLKRKELYEASKASVLDGAPAVAVDNDSGADRGAEGSIQSEL
mmetsp:Transcript_21797/g.36729  ORF Transcript_21797/g.36729 Transcript_21797/m.36729 type:complete len:443 (+) Transcript_21797:152-1480(+)